MELSAGYPNTYTSPWAGENHSQVEVADWLTGTVPPLIIGHSV